MTAAMEVRCLIYCRVSTERQEQDGTSLDTQEAACRAYADAHGWRVVAAERETFSGYALHERPGISRVRELVRAGGVGVILTYAVDRLSRRQAHVAILADEAERYGARLAFVTEDFEQSAIGEFIRGAKSFAAELELEKIKERTARGMAARLASGKLSGKKLPYGYCWPDERHPRHPDRLLKARAEVDLRAAPVVQRIYAEAVAGKPLRTIARHLATDGITSPGGKPIWQQKVVWQILTHPFYKGMAAVNIERVEKKQEDGKETRRVKRRPESEWTVLPEGTVPALVEPAVWDQVQQRIAANNEEAARRNPAPHDTLVRGGIARCGLCGHALRVSRRHLARGKTRISYCCQSAMYGKSNCPRHSIESHILDTAVWDELAHMLAVPGALRQEVQRQVAAQGSNEAELAALDRRMATIDRQLKEHARALVRLQDAPAAAAAIEAQLRQLDSDRATLAVERDDVAARVRHAADVEATLAAIEAEQPTFAQRLPLMDYEERRRLLKALQVKVKLFPRAAANRWTITSTLDNGVLMQVARTKSGDDHLVAFVPNGAMSEPDAPALGEQRATFFQPTNGDAVPLRPTG